MLKRFRKLDLFQVFQEILGEKYKFGNDTVLNDVTNGMNILIIELFDLMKTKDCIQLGSLKIDRIVAHNKKVLCEYCANFENSKFETLQKLFEVSTLEMNKIVTDKMATIDTLLYLILQTKIQELDNLFDYTEDELETLAPEILEETIGNSTEEFADDVLSEIGTIDKNRNYFLELIHYINVNLDEELD